MAQTAGSGDQDLRQRFIELMDRFESALRRLTLAYFPDPADQEDLFQEIALALWTALPRFRGDCSLRTWLYRIAHNVALSSLARKRRNRTQRVEGAMTASSGNPEKEAAGREERRQLLRAVRALPALDRQLILLYLEGLTYAEMEQATGLRQSNVGARLTRIRGRLRKELSP